MWWQVCNHPELFERNEGSSYLYFGEIPNSLLPPPFGELEIIHYSGGQNPIAYKVTLLSLYPVKHCTSIRKFVHLQEEAIVIFRISYGFFVSYLPPSIGSLLLYYC